MANRSNSGPVARGWLLTACLAVALSGPTAASETPASLPKIRQHLDAARRSAGSLWADKFNEQCNLEAVERPDPIASASPAAPITPRLPSDWAEQPYKIFDNVYFVGSRLVSAFAIDTRDGIIITDGMGEVDVAGSVIDGLTRLGLDPTRIRYVIVPHGHPDHYGGAQLLKDRFGAKIVMARADVETLRFYGARVTTASPRDFDMLVGTGDVLRLGETTVTFTTIPGHTPGGIVMDFGVSTNGNRHRMLIWSAGGSPRHTLADLRSQLAPLASLIGHARRSGIDAVADNHGSHVLVRRMIASPRSNPFLVGRQAVLGYLRMRVECDRAWLGKLQAG